MDRGSWISRIRVHATFSRWASLDQSFGRRLHRQIRERAFALTILALAGTGASNPDLEAAEPGPPFEVPEPHPLEAAEPVYIGRVTIHTTNVFGPDEADSFLQRGANALHVTTLESTVRRLLTFEEGDAYDPAILAEAERSLRARGLFRSVSIVAGEVRDGVVDVQVDTQDAWTVRIEPSAGSDGGATQGGIALGEGNFLGTGVGVGFAFAKDEERNYRSVEVQTPNFFIPFTSARLLYSMNSDGSEKVLEVRRPFYSNAAPWSAAIAFADIRRDELTYREGGEVRSTFGAAHFRLLAAYGFALPARDGNASRLSAGLDVREDRFEAPSTGQAGERPDDRRFRYVFLQYEVLRSDFLKWNYVNHDDRYEDVGLGPRLMLRLGISPAAFGVPETTGVLGLELGAGLRAGASGFVQARVAWDSRVGPSLERLENSLVAANLLYVRRFETAPRQTFLAQLSGLRGWNLDDDVQIFADARSGLRAYRLRAFEGDTRVILNLEHRVFSSAKWFGLISPGFAVFFDAGLVGGPSRPVRLTDVKMDAGVGLRFAAAWAPVTNVFRIDAGYAFQRDPSGRRGFLISFSTGQAF